MSHADPLPLERAAIEGAICAMESGTPYKAAFEALLLELADDVADRVMQLQREARGAWLLLLRVPEARERERALFIGNALSGASVPLAVHGFDVTLYDRSELRLVFAELRNAALVPGEHTTTCVADGGARLPFDDGEFDLVVQEDGLPSEARGWGHDLDELRRVCRGELVLVADNRFAYKRSTGRRGVFDVPTPLEYASKVLTKRSERSLAGYRELASASGFAPPRSFALYPHAREFTFVCGLDQPLPRVAVGPKERRNRWKMIASSLGLFPVLAPSFAILSARSGVANRATRVGRILDALAERTGEPRGELEQLVATRGNSALMLTRHGAEPRESAAGWWCVHVGLSAAQRGQLATHVRFLREIRARFPRVPVPEPLFEGELDGFYVTCERRARGLTAPQLTGELAATRATLGDLARCLAELVVEPAQPLTEAGFEELLGRRFELVARYAHVPSTVEHLALMQEAARAALIGRPFPRVIYHADLRSKHVQVEPDGRVVALLDWGSGEARDLPYFDLVHYLAHERKQAGGLDARTMWELVRERDGLRDWERAALDDYAARVGIDDEYRRAIEALYPVLVAAMAESHWDYSRPRWLQRQFGV